MTADQLPSSPFLEGAFAAPGPASTTPASWGGALLPSAREATAEEVERALASAAAAAPRLAGLARGERAHLLRKFRKALAVRADLLARTITAEVGKPIALSRAEVARAQTTVRLAAEEALRSSGELVPIDDDPSLAGAVAYTRRFPVGIVLAITPFNFPLNLAMHKVAPAMAAGCPVLLKPAPRAPRTALLLAEAAAEAGWPAGALSVLPVPNDAVAPLCADARVALISFTGSAAVGWSLRERFPRKRLVLELGGNAGVLVDETSDLPKAAALCAIGANAYAGQVCISVQRIYAVREIAAPFRDLLLEELRRIRCGDPWDDAVRCGPMIDPASADRVGTWIDEAVAAGGRLLLAGERTGNLLAPTLLESVPASAKLACEEAFGPVATFDRVEDFEDGLARLDDSRYGLQAGIFTARIDRAKRAHERLRVGGVIVGDTPTFRWDGMPYGGEKDSGLGREGIAWAIRDMTEERLLVLR